MSSLLSQIRSVVTVDVDTMDPTVTIKHTTPTEVFSDMTSNQALVYLQAIQPDSASLVKDAIAYVNKLDNSADADPQGYLHHVIDVLTVLLAKQVYPHLKGKVHAQTSPSVAYNVERTVDQAKRLVALFEAHGILKDRVCIKIPATPESLLACKVLRNADINTLATCLFSLPQAQAAEQAGCIYVAPYFNELRVHTEPNIWKEYSDIPAQHPMSPIVQSIVRALKGSKTLVMPASIVTTAEVLALASFRPDHLTISGSLLDQLALLPPVPESELTLNMSLPRPAKAKNYLENDAVLLKEAFMEEPEISRKVVDALTIFESWERKTEEFIRSGKRGVEWNGQWP